MESKKIEVEFLGTGGQGIVLASVIIAEAAGMAGIKHVLQSRNYGPERSGSRCRCEVIFSSEPVIYPKAERFNISLVLSLDSMYDFRIKDDGLIITDASINKNMLPDGVRVVQLPILKIAKNDLDDVRVANLIALGVLGGYLPCLDKGHIKEAIKCYGPQAICELNLKAFDAGVQMAADA